MQAFNVKITIECPSSWTVEFAREYIKTQLLRVFPATSAVKAAAVNIVRSFIPGYLLKKWKADEGLSLTCKCYDASTMPVSGGPKTARICNLSPA